MKLLYGKPVADGILKRLKSDISKNDEKPGLAVILIGEDSASHIYVNLKQKAAKEIGVEFFKYLFSETVEQDDVLKLIDLLNMDPEIHGIIVQLPLPEKFDTEKIISAINPKKDVDGFHPENTSQFLKNAAVLSPVFPSAIVKLIESSEQSLKGKNGIVVANSKEFGEIMCVALNQKQIRAEYILTQDITSNLGKIKNADVVVSAAGSPGLLNGQMLKDGTIVIDGGIEKVGETVVGDVDFASTEAKEGYLTPVPGGVGPVTIACLLENTYLAFKAQQKGK